MSRQHQEKAKLAPPATTPRPAPRRVHPPRREVGVTGRARDPRTADAAVDLADDFGAQFLEAATRGEDLGSRVLDLDDAGEAGPDLLLDDVNLDDDSGAGEDPEVPPAPRRPRRRRPKP